MMVGEKTAFCIVCLLELNGFEQIIIIIIIHFRAARDAHLLMGWVGLDWVDERSLYWRGCCLLCFPAPAGCCCHGMVLNCSDGRRSFCPVRLRWYTVDDFNGDRAVCSHNRYRQSRFDIFRLISILQRTPVSSCAPLLLLSFPRHCHRQEIGRWSWGKVIGPSFTITVPSIIASPSSSSSPPYPIRHNTATCIEFLVFCPNVDQADDNDQCCSCGCEVFLWAAVAGRLAGWTRSLFRGQAGDVGEGEVGTINKSEITVTTCVSNVPVLTPIFIFYMDFLGTRDTSTMYHIHQSNLHHQLHWMDGAQSGGPGQSIRMLVQSLYCWIYKEIWPVPTIEGNQMEWNNRQVRTDITTYSIRHRRPLDRQAVQIFVVEWEGNLKDAQMVN